MGMQFGYVGEGFNIDYFTKNQINRFRNNGDMGPEVEVTFRVFTHQFGIYRNVWCDIRHTYTCSIFMKLV